MEEKSREEEAVAAADAEVNAIEVGKEEDHHKPVLRRDPSFSRWCDVNGILRSNAAADDGSPGTSSAAEESEEFELPLLQQGRSEEADAEAEDQMRSQSFRQRSMCSGNANGSATKYAPLDIENGVHASDSIAKLQSLEQSKESPISAAIVLKTLFYILVWYTFSTCLTV